MAGKKKPVNTEFVYEATSKRPDVEKLVCNVTVTPAHQITAIIDEVRIPVEVTEPKS